MSLHGLVLLLCALYGSVFTFGKLTLEYAPPLFITGARMVLAGVILLGYQFFFHRTECFLKKKYFWSILVVAMTGVYLTNILEFWGLQFMEAGKACFLYSFSPIVMALLSYVWFHEKISTRKWIGLLIGVLGFLPLLIATPSQPEDDSGTFFFFSFAEIALLLAAVANSVGWLAMRHMVKQQGYSATMANATTMILGGVISLGHSFLVEPWDPTPIVDVWPFMQWFLTLTLVSNLISYNLHAVLLRSYTATYISFAGLSQPFFAAFFGWLFLGEVMSLYFWLSVIAVSCGLYVYYQEELRHGYAPSARRR